MTRSSSRRSPFSLMWALVVLVAVSLVPVWHPAPLFAAGKQSRDFVEAHKHKKKKAKAKKKKSVASIKKAGPTRPYVAPVHPEDPSVSEPSEMITAIKNRAQQRYWEGRKPLKEQMASPQKAAADLAGQRLSRASYSDILGVTFDDQPLRMGASETFRRSLDAVSFELGTPCRKPEDAYYEYLGWPLQQSEQARVDRIFEETHAKLKLRGFSVLPQRPRAAAADVSVFTAQRLKKHVIGMWSAGDAGLLLLACETEKFSKVKEAPPAPIKKKIAKKRSMKKSVSRKPASTLAPAGKQRPEVIPGAAPRDAAPVNEDKPAPVDAPTPPSTPAAAPSSPPAAFQPSAPAEQPKTESPAVPPPVPSAPPAPAVPTGAVEAPKTEVVPPVPSVTPASSPVLEAVKDKAVETVKDAVKDAAQDVVKDAVKDAVPSVPGVPKIP